MSKALLIQPDGTMKEITPAKGEDFTLKELQGYVGGGLVEPVYPPDPELIALANEEGLMLDMEYNAEASARVGTPVVGPVVIMPKEMFK